MNNSAKKRYLKPELMVVPIDQEITLVMESLPPTPPNEASSVINNSNTSEIFGNTESNVGSTTIDWGKD